jgi:hypothetical protein
MSGKANMPGSSKKLSPKEKAFLKGVSKSVDFVNKYKPGKTRHKSFKQMLDMI